SSDLRRRLIDFGAWRTALASPAIAPVILTFFLATLGFGGFETTLAMLLRDALHMAKGKTYLMFAYVGFVLMIAQGLVYRRLAKRLSEVAFMTIGIILMSIGVLSLGGLSLLAYARSGLFDAVGMVGGGAVAGEVPMPNFGLMLAILMVGMATAVFGFAFL